MSDNPVEVIWCTAPAGDAPSLARTLVAERLVACVNVLPGVVSTYHWQGRVETEDEVLMMMKTTSERRPAVELRLVELHPYDVPEVLAMPVTSGSLPYMNWVREQVSLGGAE